jgi:hypothetical protein
MKRKLEKYRRLRRVVVYVQDGAVLDVEGVPDGMTVEVRDYDTQDEDRGVKHDADGQRYSPLFYGGVMLRARSRRELARRLRLRAAAPALLAACKKLHDALSDFLESTEFQEFGGVDNAAAMRAIDASFAALTKAEPEAFDGRKQSSKTEGGAR